MAAREMIAAEGSVFGCAYTDEWKAEHREIKAEKDLWKIQSSKYVQSDIGRCYETAKARLKEGKGAVYRNSLSDRRSLRLSWCRKGECKSDYHRSDLPWSTVSVALGKIS